MTYRERVRELATQTLLDPAATPEDLRAAERDFAAREDLSVLSDDELNTLIFLSEKVQGRATDAHMTVVAISDIPPTSCVRCREFTSDDLQVLREAPYEDDDGQGEV